MKSDDDVDIPDLEFVFVRGLVDDHARKQHLGHGFSCHVTLLRPKSKGAVRLDTVLPQDSTLIDPAFLEEKERYGYHDKRMEKTVRDAECLTF